MAFGNIFLCRNHNLFICKEPLVNFDSFSRNFIIILLMACPASYCKVHSCKNNSVRCQGCFPQNFQDCMCKTLNLGHFYYILVDANFEDLFGRMITS